MDTEYVPSYRRIFDLYDVQSDGCLSISQLERLFRENGYKFKSSTTRNILLDSDTNESKTLDFFEFLKLMEFFVLMHQVFQKVDEDGTGFLKKEQFQKGLLKIGYEFSQLQFDIVFKFCDVNSDYRVEFEEFIATALQLKAMRGMFEHAMAKNLSGVINNEDEDGSNLRALSPSQFHFLAEKLGINAPKSKIDDVIKQIDENGDGRISFEEFTHFVYLLKELA